MYEVKMPQWGMDMTEGTIVRWLKQEGEFVAKGEGLAEIELAKASNTLESPVAGVITKLTANADETVLVQGLLAIIDERSQI